MYTKSLIQTEEQFNGLLNDLEQVDIFAYDTETNGQVDRFLASLVGMSFAYYKDKELQAHYIPFMHEEGEQISMHEALEKLKPILESDKKQKICHNVKFDEMVMSLYDITVGGLGHDTIVMAWLLQESRARGEMKLKVMTKAEFDYQMTTYEEVVEGNTKRGQEKDYNFARVSLDIALSYATDDAYWCFRLYEKFKRQLEKEKLWDAYVHIEGPFNRVLGKMEAKGIRIDIDALEIADKKLPSILERVESEIFEQAGEVFNISSGKQLGPILFDKLGIGKNVPKTTKGAYKTDAKTLNLYKHKHKIVEDVLRYKKITKTHGTFVEGTRKFIAKDGRIHPRFNGQGTVTGRLAGSKPNMQQIEGDEVEEIKVRSFFVPAKSSVFVVGDYSQVELRLMAHFSKDKSMIESFLSGRDFHEEVARKMFERPEGEVSRRERVIAKTLNFGVGYGRGASSIAEQLDISFKEGQEFIDNWFEQFPSLKAYKEHLLSQARKNGFIRTLSGRKRRLLPEIRSYTAYLRGHAERQAFNTKMQGSGADLIKMAMLSMQKPLEELGAQPVIQIHDELVIEGPEETQQQVVETMKHIMENPLNNKNPLRLPLVVDPVVVTNWADAK